MPLSRPYDKSFFPSAPVIDCTVSIPGGAPASSRACRGLIDSGADITAIPQNVVTELRLARVDRIPVAGYDEVTRLKDVYAAKVSVPPMEEKVFKVVVTREDYALIGRDLINHWMVTLNGKKGIVEIEGSEE